jgi:hypothetical protein
MVIPETDLLQITDSHNGLSRVMPITRSLGKVSVKSLSKAFKCRIFGEDSKQPLLTRID